jgi:hypothetical protein
VVRDIATYGGVWKWRGEYLDRFVTREVVDANISLWGQIAEKNGAQQVQLALTTTPYTLTDPLRISDPFSTDTFGTGGVYNLGGADWTADAGSLSSNTISGGVVDANSNLSTAQRWYHSGTPNVVGDHQITLKVTPGGTLTNFIAGAMLKRTASNNYIAVYVNDTGAASNLIIATTVSGSTNTRSTTALTRIVSGTAYWCRARIEGNVVHAEWWTTEPSPMATPTNSASYTLTTSEAAALGESVTGRPGVVWTPIHTSATLDDFQCDPYVYRNWTLPDVVRLSGTMPGDPGSRCDLVTTPSGGSAAPVWFAAGWWRKPAPHNMVWNDGAEGNSTSGWAASAVGGLTCASTGLTFSASTTAVYRGAYAFSFVCAGGAANVGRAFPLYNGTPGGRFKRGVTYTATARVYAASGTNTVEIALGTSGDNATGSASLSTSWQTITATWVPTADVSVADVVIRLPSNVVQTYYADDVMVYEGSTAPAHVAGGYPPVGLIQSASDDVANRGSKFSSITTDADYRGGYSLQTTGAMSTNGYAEWYILPWTLTPDELAADEVAIAVYARLEVASTQTSTVVTLSAKPEGGTSYGEQRYTDEYGSTGKTVKLPSSGTVFRPVYLGTLRFPVRRSKPVRWKLRVDITNSGAATGTFGIDYLALLPARSHVRSAAGVSTTSAFSSFVTSTSETRKRIDYQGRGWTSNPASMVSRDEYPSSDVGGANIILPRDDCQLLVLPSSYIVDRTDSNTSGMQEEHSATIEVWPTPMLMVAHED